MNEFCFPLFEYYIAEISALLKAEPQDKETEEYWDWYFSVIDCLQEALADGFDWNWIRRVAESWRSI